MCGNYFNMANVKYSENTRKFFGETIAPTLDSNLKKKLKNSKIVERCFV